MRYTLTIQESHYNEIRELFTNSETNERVAFLICGRSFIENDLWTGDIEERFLSKKVISLCDNEIISSSNAHVEWNTKTFISVLKEAEVKQYAVAVIHSHPNKFREFSKVDDDSEPNLFKLAFNRNGGDRPHLSLIINDDGFIFGRAWDCELNKKNLDMIRVLGTNYKFFYPNKYNEFIPEIFHRQQLAFGKSLIQDLSSLRIAVIGCGATGSATAFLLARLGVGQLLLIDKDNVERTNLSRLHGSTAADADAGKPKAKMLYEQITNMGIGCKVRYYQDWVGAEQCRNAIKSCDIIFGCSDDHDGRLYINRIAYFYLIPVIDMALSIRVNDEVSPPEISVLDGRVTFVFPKAPCLLCREIIDIDIAISENLQRNNPMGYERLKREAYVMGDRNPSPAVVTFTTEVATLAVNEFINRIQNYKGIENKINQKRRLFHRETDLNIGDKFRDGCTICVSQAYWGRGDMVPFLDRIN